MKKLTLIAICAAILFSGISMANHKTASVVPPSGDSPVKVASVVPPSGDSATTTIGS